MAEQGMQCGVLQSGILPDTDISALLRQGCVTANIPFAAEQIQPASLDLRLGAAAWRLRASFLPGAGRSVAEKLEQVKLHEIDLCGGAVLETGCVYLVRLLEEMALPADIAAVANPKSSTGRLDIFTRIITDGGREFDKIPQGYRGALYLEISPRSFPVLVRRGSCLSQMRFRRGVNIVSLSDLRDLQDRQQLVSDSHADISSGGLALSVDLKGAADKADKNAADIAGAAGKVSAPQQEDQEESARHIIGYRGKRHSGVVDIDKRAACAVEDFWEPIYDNRRHQLILDPNEFYILASREAINVPPLYAAEMTPFDPLVGEFRVHYAGFFDPGFGYSAAGGAGARAVLEVRSREVPFILEHGQIIGRLVYEHMLSVPQKLYGMGGVSHYQAQGLQLSKHFK